jgi:hypothetical protein
VRKPKVTREFTEEISTLISSSTRLRPIAAIAIGLTALGIAACNGTNSAVSNAGALPATVRIPHRASKPLPTPYQWSFSTVNDPNSVTFNRVMAVDDLNEICGYYGTGTASDPANGFTALWPYTRFRRLNYPGAVDTFPMSMSNSRILAGYFVDNTYGAHTWGFIRNRGIWTQYKDRREPNRRGSVTELLGINHNTISAGFYKDSYGQNEPFEFADNRFHPLNPPGFISAIATAINLRGIIVGTETLSSGTKQGWLLDSQTYYEFAYQNAIKTQVYGIDYDQQVVGSYIDSQGVTHGFVLTYPTSPTKKYWQSVDEPNAVGTTVITSMNNHHSISGWYVDSNGNTNGFVGILANTKERRRIP